MSHRIVLTADDISRSLTRMAHQIIEANKESTELIFLGIPTRGVVLAERLCALTKQFSGNAHSCHSVELDVTNFRDDKTRGEQQAGTLPSRTVGDFSENIEDKTIVLVDDVLYSGRTIRAALDALAHHGRPRAVRLAVLIDRGHRDFPIRADFVGKNLPSSHRERIRVRLTEVDAQECVVIESSQTS